MIGEGVPQGVSNFFFKAMSFTFVILSEGFEQKQLIFNQFVTNLSDICDFVGKNPKKQLKLICLLSMRQSMLQKTEGNSSKWKELRY